MKRNSFFRISVSIVLTVLLVYLLLTQINISDLTKILNNMPLQTLATALGFYGVAYIFRTFRFWILLEKKIKFNRLFNIVCIHNFFNGLLPMRTGELSFVYLVSKEGFKKTQGVAAVFIARFFDFIVIFFLFGLTTTISGAYDNIFLIAGIMSLIFIAVGLMMISLGNKYLSLFKRRKLLKYKIYAYIIEKVDDTLGHLKIMNFKKLPIFISSLMIWISNYIMSYIIINAMGVNIEAYKAVIVFSFTSIVSGLPINGILGFGTQEASWSVAFLFFGVAKEIAISSAFGFHLINILYFFLFGILGLACRNFRKIKSFLRQ
ncbi:flippase-like domain-containing protein [Candidatus Woesearchaeota archaeon]|nr:flippase-like domain-containing protein [Candidatus Woesearchaeota archaeon]